MFGSVGDAALTPGGPSRAFPGVPAARRGPADGRQAGGWSERSPAKWPGPHTVDFVAVTLNRHTRTERTDHRGERGANLTNTARGTPLDLADLRHYQDFDKPRCCEASRPVGPSGPQASRAPSDFFEAGGFLPPHRRRTRRQQRNRAMTLAWMRSKALSRLAFQKSHLYKPGITHADAWL